MTVGFTITTADIGRYVRRISTSEVGRIRRDGNGWLYPGSIYYEWQRIADDLEYVMIEPAWPCRARIRTYSDPVDCDWPYCGCDPQADKCLEAIIECGRDPETVRQRALESVAEFFRNMKGDCAALKIVADVIAANTGLALSSMQLAMVVNDALSDHFMREAMP